MGVVAEEADESQGWLEFIEAAELIKSETLTRLIGEATELAAITSAAYGTARYNKQQKKKRRS
jgi:hypothetical protein